jgi:hypothetical protein
MMTSSAQESTLWNIFLSVFIVPIGLTLAQMAAASTSTDSSAPPAVVRGCTGAFHPAAFLSGLVYQLLCCTIKKGRRHVPSIQKSSNSKADSFNAHAVQRIGMMQDNE